MIGRLITDMTPGEYDILDGGEDIVTPPSGFDSWNLKLLHFNPDASSLLLEQFNFAIGLQFDVELEFWVQDRKFRRAGAPGLFEVDLQCLGRARADKPVKVSIEADGQEIEVTNATIYDPSLPGGFLVTDKLSWLGNNLVIRVTYMGTGHPPTNRVGYEGDPPYTALLPPEFWSTLADPRYHWPRNYTLTSMPVEFLVGVDPLFWQATDVWTYRQFKTV